MSLLKPVPRYSSRAFAAGILSLAACLPAGISALTPAALCGCGTVSSRTQGNGGPYHGFSADMEKVNDAGEWLAWSGEGRAGAAAFTWPRGLFWLLDAPLSLTADTLLLPFDYLRPKPPETQAEAATGQPRGPAAGSERSSTRTPAPNQSPSTEGPTPAVTRATGALAGQACGDGDSPGPSRSPE